MLVRGAEAGVETDRGTGAPERPSQGGAGATCRVVPFPGPSGTGCVGSLGLPAGGPLEPARAEPVPRVGLRLAEIVPENAQVRTFRMVPTGGPVPAFRPGAWLSLRVDLPGVLTSRPFSISSRPGASWIDLTVRLRPGASVTSRLFREARVGDEFTAVGPVGAFRLDAPVGHEDLVLLASGSGIAPFMSLLRDRAVSREAGRVHLLYASRSRHDALFGTELAAMARDHEWFRYALVVPGPGDDLDGPEDGLDGTRIVREVGDLGRRTFVVCGPSRLHEFVGAELAALRVPRHRIRRDSFLAPAEVTQWPHWPAGLEGGTWVRVRVDGGPTVPARAGEPLMSALERAGVLVPCGCRSGVCGLCRVQVRSGRVFLPPNVALRELDGEGTWVNACSAYPVEDAVIRL